MIHVAGDEKSRKMLYRNIPEWNLMCRELVCQGSVSEDEIFDYVPKRRYQWSDTEWLDEKFNLEPGDEYPLDKELLLKLI